MKKYLGFLFILIFSCEKLTELETINTQLIITGRVIDKYTKEGVSSATIRIKSGTGFKTTTTQSDNAETTDINEAGYFILEDVITRGTDLKFIISKTDYQSYETKINTYISSDEELAVREIDLSDLGLVKPNETISGIVFGPSGPLSGITVVIENTTQPEAGNYFAQTTSGDAGVFTFSNIPATSGYKVYTLPYDINSDGIFDFGSVMDTSVSAENTASTVDKKAYLVLAEGDFDLIYSNIKQPGSTGYGTLILTSTTSSLEFYFNKPVSGDFTLKVDCNDTLINKTIPLSLVVDSIKVTATTIDNFQYGHSYSCAITARSLIGEENSETNSFMVLADTSPSTITDLSYNQAQTNKNECGGTDTGLSYGDLEKQGAGTTCDTTGSLSARFTFSPVANSTYYYIHVRNNDIDNATYSAFDLDTAETMTVKDPTTYYDYEPTTATTSTVIDTTYMPSTQTSIAFDIDLRPYIPTFNTGITRSVYIVIRACNSAQTGVSASVDSTSCVFSNVAQLDSTR
jgi:hypothetical protein